MPVYGPFQSPSDSPSCTNPWSEALCTQKDCPVHAAAIEKGKMGQVEVGIEVVLGKSQFDNLEPRLDFAFNRAATRHKVGMCLHAFAAEVEAQTEAHDPWVVVVDLDKRNVHLELVYNEDEGDEVAKRGILRLMKVVANYPSVHERMTVRAVMAGK